MDFRWSTIRHDDNGRSLLLWAGRNTDERFQLEDSDLLRNGLLMRDRHASEHPATPLVTSPDAARLAKPSSAGDVEDSGPWTIGHAQTTASAARPLDGPAAEAAPGEQPTPWR